MSALDQAFIKVFKQGSSASGPAPDKQSTSTSTSAGGNRRQPLTQGPATGSRATGKQPAPAAVNAAAEPAADDHLPIDLPRLGEAGEQLDSLYADGALYREERAGDLAHPGVPRPHVHFDASDGTPPRTIPRPATPRPRRPRRTPDTAAPRVVDDLISVPELPRETVAEQPVAIGEAAAVERTIREPSRACVPPAEREVAGSARDSVDSPRERAAGPSEPRRPLTEEPPAATNETIAVENPIAVESPMQSGSPIKLEQPIELGRSLDLTWTAAEMAREEPGRPVRNETARAPEPPQAAEAPIAHDERRDGVTEAARHELPASPTARVESLQWVIAAQPGDPPLPATGDQPLGDSCHVLLQVDGLADASPESGDVCGEWIDVHWLDRLLAGLQSQKLPQLPNSDAPDLAASDSAVADFAPPSVEQELEREELVEESVAPSESEMTGESESGETATGETAIGESGTAEDVVASEDSGAPELPRKEPPSEVAWEVDRFRWPPMCDRLHAAEQAYFEHAGEKLREASRDGLQVLAVTSSQRGEGRTTLALMLARAAAAAGARVALLEADAHAPRIAGALGLEIPCDWPHALARQLSWTEAAIVSLEDGITVLPLDDSGQSVSPRLAHNGVTALIDHLAGEFDLVVIDGPPIGDPRADFFQTGDDCPLNAVILVQDHRLADPDRTADAVRRLRETGVEAIGIAHNFCSKPAA